MCYISIAHQIGGAVNFVAVSDILQTAPELVAAAMAADNVVVAVYFAFLFSLCRPSSEEELLAMKPKIVEGKRNWIILGDEIGAIFIK